MQASLGSTVVDPISAQHCWWQRLLEASF